MIKCINSRSNINLFLQLIHLRLFSDTLQQKHCYRGLSSVGGRTVCVAGANRSILLLYHLLRSEVHESSTPAPLVSSVRGSTVPLLWRLQQGAD